MTPPPEFPIIPSDRSDDLCNLHLARDCDLALFMAGNQFMVMPELIHAFKSRNPKIRAIFYETLPPRLELNQILSKKAQGIYKKYGFVPQMPA